MNADHVVPVVKISSYVELERVREEININGIGWMCHGDLALHD